jgi:hypothetical protein
MRLFKTLLSAMFLFGAAYSLTAQCIPPAAAVVFGTVPGANGTYNFTNVPTGRVIQLTAAAANTQFAIDMCITNPGANVPSGTNDSHLSILNQNGPGATVQATFEDGCTNMAAPGYGPDFGTWTAPTAGTFFLYLTEWNAAGNDNCIADGVNSNYDFAITVTAPPSTDAAITRDALEYTLVKRAHIAGALPLTGVINNVGGGAITGATVTVNVATQAAPGVSIFSATSPATNVPAGGTANAVAGNWTPPAGNGAYVVTYTVNVAGDANLANNTLIKPLYLTTDFYGRDYNTLAGGLGINGTGLIRQGAQYTFLQGDVVEGCEYFLTGGQPGDTVQLEVYTLAAGVVSATPVATGPVYVLTAADSNLLAFPLAAPLTVNNTTTYLFSLLHRSRNVNIGLGYSDSLYVATRNWIRIGANAWTNPEAFGFNIAYITRPYFASCPTLTSTTSSNNAVCTAANGTATVTPAGGAAPYTFSWSNGANTQTANGLAAGSFTVTFTDVNNCSASASVTVGTTQIALTISSTTTNATCTASNGSATAAASGGTAPYTYTWSNGANGQTANNLTAGSYTVTATDANGCTGTTSVTVNATQSTVSVNATSTPATCVANGSATASANGGQAPYNFAWSNGATGASIAAPAGSYSVTATDANGCTGTASTNISNPNAPTATLSATAVTCNGGNNGAVSMTVSGGVAPYTFAWSNGATTQNISGLTAGTYSATVTDANNCAFNASANVSQPAAIALTGANITNVSCFGGNNGAIDISVGGGTAPYSYSWSNGATTQDVTGLIAGTYSGTITDANGCTASAAAPVTEPSEIQLTGANLTNVSCFGGNDGALDITIGGGTAPYSYSWSNGATTEDISDLTAGTYSGTITDANGCTFTGGAPITEPAAALNVTATVTPSTGNDGAIDVTVSGGTAPYTFNWSNGATTEDISGLAPGIYSGTITDANGCSTSADLDILPTGMENINGLNAFSMFPNPTNGQLNISMDFSTSRDLQVAIFTATGQMVTAELVSNVRTYQQVFNFAHLAEGTYFVRFTFDNQVVTRRFTVVK